MLMDPGQLSRAFHCRCCAGVRKSPGNMHTTRSSWVARSCTAYAPIEIATISIPTGNGTHDRFILRVIGDFPVGLSACLRMKEREVLVA
jgi:hypothetical protein